MFYIVETTEQLNEFIHTGYSRAFVEPIYYNDHAHPAINELSLLYVKPTDDNKGYILCLKHNEALSLNKTAVNSLLNSFEELYVRDRKSFLYSFQLKNIIDISFLSPELPEPTTPTHEFFYQRFGDQLDLNTVIPLVKHYERCELIYNQIKQYCIKPANIKYYNRLTNVFLGIEKNGIKLNESIFNKYFELNHEQYSIQNSKIYTQYNLYTTTGRPSNSFNGINFAALTKDNGCRAAFVPKNGQFIELDVSAYHPTLAAQLIGYDFKNETPYQYFAREADIPLIEAKTLMFKQLYGGIYNEYKYIEFFELIESYVNELWAKFTNDRFIECPISGHKFTTDIKDINPQKLFNYMLQNLETSNNVLILWEIMKLLKGKSTQIVLYTYDSILIDYDEDEELIDSIKHIFNNKNLKVKLTIGRNYGSMQSLN